MAKHLGNQLPPALLDRLRGAELYRAGTLGLPIVTLDDAGWPHIALAAGAAAAQPGQIWIALGSKTGSLTNVERDGRVTLLIAGPETLFYVKGRAELVRREMSAIPGEAALRIDITEVLEDSKPFLTVTGGITYQWHFMSDEYKQVMDSLLDELAELAGVE